MTLSVFAHNLKYITVKIFSFFFFITIKMFCHITGYYFDLQDAVRKMVTEYLNC